MELPFAVEESPESFLNPPSGVSVAIDIDDDDDHHVHRHLRQEQRQKQHNSNVDVSGKGNSNGNPSVALPTTSPHAYQNVSVSSSQTSLADTNSHSKSHSQPQPNANRNRNGNGNGNGDANANISTSPSTGNGNGASSRNGNNNNNINRNLMNNARPAAAAAAANLHRVALYNNVHPHYYTPKPLSSVNSNTRGNSNVSVHTNVHSGQNMDMEASMIRVPSPNRNGRGTNTNTNNEERGQVQQTFSDDDFVTITADGYGYSNSNSNSNNQSVSSNMNLNIYQNHQYPQGSTPSMETQNHLSASKTSSPTYGHQMDILSLLLNSVTTPLHTPSSPFTANSEKEPEPEDSEHSNADTETKLGIDTNTDPDMMKLCSLASQAATEASQHIQKGNIALAVQCQLKSSKAYKDAAIALRTGTGGGTVTSNANDNAAGKSKEKGVSDLSFLAYSLLVLSNAQARSANSLVKNGGVSVSVNMNTNINANQYNHRGAENAPKGAKRMGGGKHGSMKNNTNGNGSRSIPVGGERKEITRPRDKKDRLRDKIQTSFNKAEPDMTDSTFLGRAVSRTNANANTNANTNANNNPAGSNAAMNRQSATNCMTIPQNSKALSNPVDDMMELEQELKDMDATLDLGVNLSASTSSLGTKKGLEEGSFCVVPGSGNGASSSYMSSSMMWASGIGVGVGAGGRPQHPHTNNSNPKNRVQNHLGASSMSMHRSPSTGGHQQLHQQQQVHQLNHVPSIPKHHPSLEASWWGQTSALASSTSSLTNSMVGIRSSNIGTSNAMNLNMGINPANNKQVFRLLDSLKTLSDENSSLLREVEDCKKIKVEAKSAQEAMRQFKHDYKHKFSKLKSALETVRKENPSANNIVTNSNHTRRSHSNEIQNKTAEIQKRDKMIQMLKAESQKKDDKLRKYEKFYQQVKLRSDQKKKQKEQESKNGSVR